MSARIAFDEELSILHKDLIKMGALIEEAIENSIKALNTKDSGLAREIIANDKNIDDMEKIIESRCLSLLLRQQPVAKDLRAISAALKIITDMERIGDQAADIADLSFHLNKTEDVDVIAKDLPFMAAKAIEMVHASIDAYIKSDLQLSRETMLKDDIVDEMFLNIRKELIDVVKTKSQYADQAIDVMMVAKYLERIGDHAVNICEWVEFYETGEHKNTKII